MSDSGLHIESFFHVDTGTWSHVASRGRDAVVIDPVLDYDPKAGRVSNESARALLDFVGARSSRRDATPRT